MPFFHKESCVAQTKKEYFYFQLVNLWVFTIYSEELKYAKSIGYTLKGHLYAPGQGRSFDRFVTELYV
jgi:hypothetical protein